MTGENDAIRIGRIVARHDPCTAPHRMRAESRGGEFFSLPGASAPEAPRSARPADLNKG